MKKTFFLACLTGFVAQVFSQALSVYNGGFESTIQMPPVTCTRLVKQAQGWHGLGTQYLFPSQCNSPATDYIDYGYPFVIRNTDGCGPTTAYLGNYYAQSSWVSPVGSPSGYAFNSLVYQQMTNNANSNTSYRATAYVKAISGYGVVGHIGIFFINTNVGSSAAQILNAARAITTFPNPTYTSVGNGWYKLTVDWTPPSTGAYYILIGRTNFCDDYNSMQSNFGVDEVSITCLADAGPDKSNADRNCCLSPQYTSVQIGTYHNAAGLSYSWSPTSYLSCTTCQQPLASPHNTTNYTLTVSGQYCLTATDVVKVSTNIYSQYCCNPPDRWMSESESPDINIYPNPTTGIISLTKNTSKPAEIYIYDILGKEILRKSMDSNFDLDLDLGKLPKGVYNLKGIINDEVITKKIVLQ